MKKILSKLTLLIMLCIFFMIGCVTTTTKGKQPDIQQAKSNQAKNVEKMFVELKKQKGKYKALVIGINKYKDPSEPELKTAEKDAKEIVKVLKDEYGFTEATPLIGSDATRSNIINHLRNLALTSEEKDSILIYYAGHGEQDDYLGGGWWIPYDASSSDIASYIDNNTIQGIMKKMKARHVLLISDSCFSGSLLGRSIMRPLKIDPDYYNRLFFKKKPLGPDLRGFGACY